MLATLERHPHARAVLGGALAGDAQPSHAYLFHGPGGAGKREAARQIAAALLSAGEADPENARDRALAGSHPDLTWVAPSGAHELLVSDIDRPVVAAATRTPFESSRRVFVIESVDQLGDEAANRMLKTLEEPSSFVHMILVTDRLGEVLPTIRSRCQLVRFDGPSVDALAAELHREGAAADTAAACARLCLGDATVARELAGPEGTVLRAAAEAFVRSAICADTAARAPWKDVLDGVRARGERLKAELDEQMTTELELVPRKERKRLETEWTDRVRRGRRRVETASLDLVLTVAVAWLLDLVALGVGDERLVRSVDRRAELRGDLAVLTERFGTGTGPRAGSLADAVAQVEETRTRFRLNLSEDLALEALAYRLERTLGR